MSKKEQLTSAKEANTNENANNGRISKLLEELAKHPNSGVTKISMEEVKEWGKDPSKCTWGIHIPTGEWIIYEPWMKKCYFTKWDKDAGRFIAIDDSNLSYSPLPYLFHAFEIKEMSSKSLREALGA